MQFSSSPALSVQGAVIDKGTCGNLSAETLPPGVHPVQKPGMRDDGFKYQPGDIVTHVGFLKPTRHPAVPRFQVIAQTLEMAPHGPQRYYYIRPAASRNSGGEGTIDTIRVQEDHLASLQEEE